ncbi:MAG: pseudouridine synthase [Pseudomonadota bacterium]
MDASFNQERVDKQVQKLFPELSSRHIEEAIDAGWITVEGKKVRKGDRVRVPQLQCLPLQQHVSDLRKGNSKIRLSVVWEGKGEWIVDKPAGMPSHPLSLFDQDTPTQWAFAQKTEMWREFPSVQPTITPHRLDTGTSGLLIVCKNYESYLNWRSRFQSKLVHKKYLAWCFGKAPSKQLRIEIPIAHSPSDSRLMVAVRDQEKVRPPIQEAVTNAQLRREQEGMSLWEITCTTGVTHQVRVHMAAEGLPLVGDELYDLCYSARALKPKYHQLRACELSWEGTTVVAPSETFVSGPVKA